MGDIVKASVIEMQIANLQTVEECRDMLAKLDYAKSALEAADQFREKSVLYAQCEAFALVRVVEIAGNTDLIPGKYRKLAAEWLASLDEADRAEYVSLCSDGKTIENVYKEIVYKPAQRSALANTVKDCKKQAREQLRNSGAVNVPNIVRAHSHEFPKSMLKEITDGVRSAVRDAGGVGIGGNTGIYIDPDKKSEYVSDAIQTRIEAVARDIEGIADLANRSESKPVFHIRGDGDQLSFVDVTYMILAGTGCVRVSFDTPRAKKRSTSLLRQIAGDV